MLKLLAKWETSQGPNIKSVAQIVRMPGDRLRLSEVARQGVGAATGLKFFLTEKIAKLSMFYNLGKQITQAQAAETATLIIDQFGPRLVLADIILFIRKFKAGEYGKLFDRLDGGVIVDAMNDYLEEKTNEIDRKNYEEHQQTKTIPGQEFAEWSPEIREQMSEAFKKIAVKYQASLNKEGKRRTFNTIEAWCRSEFIDEERYMADFEKEIKPVYEEYKTKQGFDLDLERFTRWQYARKLAEINKQNSEKI